MNYLDEIDDNLPRYIHPWMPSIKATKKRQEKEEAQGSSDEGGPSGGTPSDARGPDHQFPEKPDSDSDSCPPTPATPAIPVKVKSPLPHKTIGLGHVPVSDKRKSLDNERISPKTEKSKIQSKIDSMFDISDTDSPPPPTPKKQPETSAFSLDE